MKLSLLKWNQIFSTVLIIRHLLLLRFSILNLLLPSTVHDFYVPSKSLLSWVDNFSPISTELFDSNCIHESRPISYWLERISYYKLETLCQFQKAFKMFVMKKSLFFCQQFLLQKLWMDVLDWKKLLWQQHYVNSMKSFCPSF